ncbi:hypothetical protein [Nostoc sp. KVJ20]|uniref:hypothetical protein n=1 Tax=Nostoc sp. KVJ20 TaxID=457944 RepID=UPI001C406829|nr:hypothetical protein [Nostoc sp. KVJ20]
MSTTGYSASQSVLSQYNSPPLGEASAFAERLVEKGVFPIERLGVSDAGASPEWLAVA